jgi:catechol 2,3-dioxygenase-like lactoylglutathione lyase family enzyme
LTTTGFRVIRAGAILAVADLAASLRFYRDQLGLEVLVVYEDPPYATLTAAAARISLAEQNHPAQDRPGVTMSAPADRSRANVVVVLEVDNVQVARQELGDRGVPFLADIYYPPWGGGRFFCVDPDGYLVEIEEPG